MVPATAQYPACTNCGEQHPPRSNVHIYWADASKRTRKRCPYHKRLCYATRKDYYDTVHYFFDCGTFLDAGYGEWRKPKDVLKAERRAARERRKARLAVAS